jgi:hypothetical protein
MTSSRLGLVLRGLKLWVLVSAALAGLHRLRGGDWSHLAEDLAWAAAAAALVVLSRRWHASRGRSCAMCVDSDAPGRK